MTLTTTDADARLDATIRMAVNRLRDGQHVTGCWTDCFDTGVMPDAQTVICLYLLGVDDDDWITILLQRLLEAQRPDGTWGVYPGDEGDLSTTVECYYALQLHGAWSGLPERQAQAKQFILRQGGLKRCRNLTKVILAIGGEIPWRWLPSPRVYSLLFSQRFPVSIFDMVTFTRLHVAPMLLLSSCQFVAAPADGRMLADLMSGHLWGRRLQSFDKRGARRRLSRRMSHCLAWMLAEREADGTTAGYHSSTFLTIFAMQALGFEVGHREIQSAIQAMRKNLYRSPDAAYVHQQTCNAHVWNTALAVRALLVAGEDVQSSVVQKAVQYLLTKQQHGQQIVRLGGWAFSSNNTQHPDTDDTIACLEALCLASMTQSAAWSQGITWLLGMQNRDGGWSAFEKDANKRWMEWIPANDMRRAMHDPSTPDITGRVLEFLLRYRVLSVDDPIVRLALQWLHRHQEADGSWFGRWGTTYIYGTWCAVKALLCAQVQSSAPSIAKARAWILRIQHDDGGFGESCQSDLHGHFVPLAASLPTQTAWGLDLLLYLYEAEMDSRMQDELWRACSKAANWLVTHAKAGMWEEEMPTGSAFPGALHIRYHIYPKIWSVVALKHYQTLRQRRFRLKGGESHVGSKPTTHVSFAY
ncbi:prenyltransferase/squalene oxidase repeat-containing protein [Alicyclobacillus fodiniaquatilis]|uniref:Prenyltransferase/squalene oxidase repeat-containing protein n=1 Tax=Alicyclobacillus fodiniaquatilis TaxID=1661150 RepID=A0ABW4JLU5_9BACL